MGFLRSLIGFGSLFWHPVDFPFPSVRAGRVDYCFPKPYALSSEPSQDWSKKKKTGVVLVYGL